MFFFLRHQLSKKLEVRALGSANKMRLMRRWRGVCALMCAALWSGAGAQMHARYAVWQTALRVRVSRNGRCLCLQMLVCRCAADPRRGPGRSKSNTTAQYRVAMLVPSNPLLHPRSVCRAPSPGARVSLCFARAPHSPDAAARYLTRPFCAAPPPDVAPPCCPAVDRCALVADRQAQDHPHRQPSRDPVSMCAV